MRKDSLNSLIQAEQLRARRITAAKSVILKPRKAELSLEQPAYERLEYFCGVAGGAVHGAGGAAAAAQLI